MGVWAHEPDSEPNDRRHFGRSGNIRSGERDREGEFHPPSVSGSREKSKFERVSKPVP